MAWRQEARISFCCQTFGYLKLSWGIATVGWSQEARTSSFYQPLGYLKLSWSIATEGWSQEARTHSVANLLDTVPEAQLEYCHSWLEPRGQDSFCCQSLGYLKLSWSSATVGWSQEARTHSVANLLAT
jgi:hypothetical protein